MSDSPEDDSVVSHGALPERPWFLDPANKKLWEDFFNPDSSIQEFVHGASFVYRNIEPDDVVYLYTGKNYLNVQVEQNKHVPTLERNELHNTGSRCRICGERPIHDNHVVFI